MWWIRGDGEGIEEGGIGRRGSGLSSWDNKNHVVCTSCAESLCFIICLEHINIIYTHKFTSLDNVHKLLCLKLVFGGSVGWHWDPGAMDFQS